VDQLDRAIAAIDAANAEDPTIVTVRERTGPKEIVHAELVSEWVRRLRSEPDDALLLAARGHHFRRWTSPRATYPAGRAGYLRWRKALHEQHARELGVLLTEVGYEAPMIARVQALVRKEGLGRDADAQVLEDALCLVFLETQLVDVAARLDADTLQRVIVKTARKMSPDGLALIADVPLTPGGRRVLDEALGRDVVQRYLTALVEHDWSSLTATLASDVYRIGPYRDVCDGRDAYAAFLEATITALSGYELAVRRMTASGGTVAVELSETVDDAGSRLRTDEVVVFDVAAGLISHVAVYLQTSERLSGG
jgi:ketosteroid isomerase-like protein